MSTLKGTDTGRPTSVTTALEGLMSGELSLNEFIQRSDQPATDLQMFMNAAFQAAIARILTVNDIYGNRAIREVVLTEVNGLSRFSKRISVLCLSESLRTMDSDE